MCYYEFTSFDGTSKLGSFETVADTIELTQQYINDCAKCGTPCNVSIKNNETGKMYKFDDFKKRFGKK